MKATKYLFLNLVLIDEGPSKPQREEDSNGGHSNH